MSIRFSSLLTLAALAIPAVAMAHGGDPLPRDLHDVGEGAWVFSTNFGIIAWDDPQHYVCEEAFLGGDNFLIAPLGESTWVTFSETRVMRTTDGCDFEEVMTLTEVPVAVSGDIASQRVAFVTNQDDLPSLQLSEDAGASWRGIALTLAGEKEVQWTGVELLGDDRAYLSAYSREEDDRGAALFFTASLETGELTEHAFLEGARYPYLFDADGERMAGLVNLPDGIALFWGAPDELDWGAQALESWPTDIQLSEQGAMVHVSSTTMDGGVMVGRWDGATPTFEMILPEHSARCVTPLADDLYICARRDREGHDLSRWRDGELEAVVEFKKLEGPPPACPADSDTGRTCKVVWPELAKALRIELPDDEMPPLEEDMGTSPGEESDMGADMTSTSADAGDDMLETQPTPPSTCATAPVGPGGDTPVMLLGVWLLGGACARRRVRI